MTKEVILGKAKAAKPPKAPVTKEKSFFSTREKMIDKLSSSIDLESAPETEQEAVPAAAPSSISTTTKKALDLFSSLDPTKKGADVAPAKLTDGRLDPTLLMNPHKDDLLVLANLPEPISPAQGVLRDGRLDPTKLMRSDPNQTLAPVSESLSKALKR
jgi:hypothetical protein